MKYAITYDENNVIFTDEKNRVEKLGLVEALNNDEAVRTLTTEAKAAASASIGAVSLLTAMIRDNIDRLGTYRGCTPLLERTQKELMAAIRDTETSYIRPIFERHHEAKKAKPATIERLWQEFAAHLRAGGSYAVAKGTVCEYFAKLGKLPDETPNGQLLTVAAMKKIIAAAKAEAEKPTDEGFAGALIKISAKISGHVGNDWSLLGDTATGIAALKSMLATYERVHAINLETLTAVKTGSTDVATTTAEAIAKAQAQPAAAVVVE